MAHRPSHSIVVIAGAGASRKLGDSSPMPLMADWSNSLVQKLEELEPGLPATIGLIGGMRGDEFEEALGSLLAFEASLPLYERFARMGTSSFTVTTDQYPAEWLHRARKRVEDTVETVRGNLYDSFGVDRFNTGLAYSAYNGLRTSLAEGGAQEPKLSFATTNYDLCIESALKQMNFTVLDGFKEDPVRTPTLDPQGIADIVRQSNGNSAVLHLHGAVGWYRDDGGTIRRLPGDLPYTPALGVPALLLPDASKTITSFVGAEQLWTEFGGLLRDATHVMFLGHSLNDEYLVRFVSQWQPRTAVCWFGDARSGPGPTDDERIKSLLPSAIIVEADFGPHPIFEQAALSAWLNEP